MRSGVGLLEDFLKALRKSINSVFHVCKLSQCYPRHLGATREDGQRGPDTEDMEQKDGKDVLP